MAYTHLTKEQRYRIQSWQELGMSQTEIAERLGKDRSAAYMARLAAKSVVAAGLAKQCFVSVAYAIGRAEPVMVEAMNEQSESLRNWVVERFDFRPLAMIERLGLRKPIF